jgi:SMC interacting uncharacterized protein involved in chromosome segregation
MSAMNKLREEFVNELKNANVQRENLLKQRNVIDNQVRNVEVQCEQLKGAIYALNEAEARIAADTKAPTTEAKVEAPVAEAVAVDPAKVN